MIYLVVDDVAGRARLTELRAALGDPTTATLNVSVFDGARLDLSDLMGACEAMPFLAARRLVIVRGLAGRSSSESVGDAPRRGRAGATDQPLLDYLERVPPTTDLVLLESDVPSASRLTRTVERMVKEGTAEIVRDAPLDPHGAADWARIRAVEAGGRLSLPGAHALVDAIGTDRRSLAREIEKIVLFADGREAGESDVAAIVTAVSAARVFELVDAIGNRNARAAIRTWRTLIRAGEDSHRLLAMLARQIRLLIQAAALSREGATPARLAQVVALPPGLAAGLMTQARRWSASGLETVLARLVELDRESKTGGPKMEPALEGLIADLVAAAPERTARR